MNNEFIFLRHADTEKDPTVNAALWGLSKDGQEQAEAVVHNPVMDKVAALYVSEERKTHLTAAPLAQKLGIEPIPLAAFNEVARGDKFLTKEAFEEEKKKQLLDLNYKAFGGESGIEALQRFKAGVAEVDRQHTNLTILIVTHGTVLNIYFADLLKAYAELPERWKQTAFCAYGIVKGADVTKDIIS